MTLVRLRSRPAPRRGADWAEPDPPPWCTTVGNLDSPHRALVGAAGTVTIAARSWSLEWWIGAEDRWHVPASEAAVRQSLVGQSPVVETRVRIPSGDAVQHVYAALGPGGEDVLVVEITNDSKVPFALALALRPSGPRGPGRIDVLALAGNVVCIDGRVAMALPRSPGRMVLGSAEGGDAADVVFSGAAEAVRADEISCADGLANGAFLFPLAHTATLRVVLPLHGGGAVDPEQLPSAAQVASGWGVQARRAATFEVPERRLREALIASTRHLLLAATTTADPGLAAALDLLGFAAEAGCVLMADPVATARADAPGSALHALGWHWALTHDLDAAAAAVPVVASLVARLRRTADADDLARGRAALPLVAGLLHGAGETVAARDVRTLAGSPADPTRPAFDLDAHLAAASPTWTWRGDAAGPDLHANAALVGAVREALVQEIDGGLALSRDVPERWLGQGWEVHDAPTAHGRLSYAVRWHGERPALLWELEPHPGQPASRLTVPGLDPTWSTVAPQGEALLSPVAVPERPSRRRGLSLPVTIEPPPRRVS